MNLWQQLFDWLKRAFTLTQVVARLQQENIELRGKLEENTDILRRVVFELEHDREIEKRDRENLMLRVELELQRRLPPPPRDERDA